MAFADLRAWIDCLESAGQLNRIKVEVDWNEEMGLLTRVARETSGHALLFENIKGYQEGRFRKVFTNFGRVHQLAMALGLPPDTSPRDVVNAIRQGFKGRLQPVEVATAPVKQNILHGDEVNLYDIPVPKWNPGDGGRYINTQCGVVTRDPDSGWLNVGLYRGMIGDRSRIPVLMHATQHWGIHCIKYRERKQKMPIAVFYGGEPLLAFVAANPVPAGVSEYEVVGALRGKPVELVRCETSDLLAPADAEIVVEGYIDPDPSTYMREGPFREYTGYYTGSPTPKPVIQVSCMTFRDDPIYEGGTGTATAHPNFRAIAVSALAWNLLEDAGVPGVTDVWSSAISAGKLINVQIHKTYRGQAKQVAAALWGTTAAQGHFKQVTVVEEDIDIRNPAHLEWAMSFRLNAAENDIVIFPGTPGSVLDPSMRPEDRDSLKYGCGVWAKVLFDCTRNWEYSDIPPAIEFVPDPNLLPHPLEEYGL